jgi:metacaspase-1
LNRIRAVLVGVDEYEHPDIPSLRGCVNDVWLVRWVLKTRLSVSNEDIRVLVNRRATKSNIVERVAAALRLSQPGDVVVFYFSGHGSQIRDREGDELTDRLDELICPFDMDWDKRSYLVDDDIDELAHVLPPGVVLEAFFDCCFWGPGPDALAPAELDGGPRSDVRYLAPPVDLFARAEGEEDRIGLHRLGASPSFRGRNVLWGASREGQPAGEDTFGGRTHGVFTYYGCRFIAHNLQPGAARRYSREHLLADLRDCFRALDYDQRPELAAPAALRAAQPFLTD